MLRFVAFLLFFCCAAQICAQQYNFRNYSVKEGVAQSQVYSLLQDKRGYIWMGTRGGGLSAYDGISFKNFTEKDGLINNYVYCIKQDKKSNLWIGTNDGISCFNGLRFINYRPDELVEPLWVLDMSFDRQGRLWLATNHGVLLFANKKFTFVSDLIHEDRMTINSILVDSKGLVWYGSGKGLFQIREKQGKFSCIKLGDQSRYMNNAITCIRENKAGELWVGTYGDGAYGYDGKRFFRPDLKQELYKQTVLDIFFDRQDNLWFATLSQGVAQYNPLAKSFSWLGENEGLSNMHVRSIIQDNCGSFWFGTSGGGVCNYFGKQFTTYDKSSGLSGNFIYSVFRDSRKRLWIGTSQKGLSCLTDSGFVAYNASHLFQDVKVKCIIENDRGEVFFGTDGQGLYLFQDSAFQLVPGFEKKYIRALTKDLYGDIWVGTAGTGIFKISEGKGGLSVRNFTVADGLLYNRITSLHCDKKGRIWYGTETSGIGFIEHNKPNRNYLRKEQGLASNLVRCLSEDQSGRLWVGTAGDGISSFPLYNGSFKMKSYTFQDGLTSGNIYLLTCDKNNKLIAGSESGLDYISLNAQGNITRVRHYGKGDGFTGIETCQNAVFNDKDGTIWFGTINGLTHYNPANLVKNTNAPILSMLDVKLFYESLSKTPYKSFVKDWNQVNKLVFPHDQNHLGFEFFALNLSNPEGVKYSWKLAGFDPHWSPVSPEHRIVYSNISPGDYTFLVKSCNEDGVWNASPIRIPIHIAAPWWMTWWFIGLEILGGMLLIAGIFGWQSRRIKAQSEEERRKLLLEKEMVELEQKALRLQMNPHFIFNALNSIQSQIGTGNEKEARYYLAKFSGLMRQILDNSRNSTITLQEEINTLENYLLIEKYCNGDRFDYQISVDAKIETDYIHIPPMLLQPFIENAIKHGMKQPDDSGSIPERGLIQVTFTEKDNYLVCTVTDNGIGREKAAELIKNSKESYHKSTALLVTQERLDLLNEAQLKGSLEIIDLYDAAGVAAGTKVVVKVPLG